METLEALARMQNSEALPGELTLQYLFRLHAMLMTQHLVLREILVRSEGAEKADELLEQCRATGEQIAEIAAKEILASCQRKA